jgi:hypothetical protein
MLIILCLLPFFRPVFCFFAGSQAGKTSDSDTENPDRNKHTEKEHAAGSRQVKFGRRPQARSRKTPDSLLKHRPFAKQIFISFK